MFSPPRTWVLLVLGLAVVLGLILQRSDPRRTDLEKAVIKNDLAQVRTLLDQGVPPKPPSGDYSLLHIARSGECVDLLVAHGADVNAATRLGTTPLHVAAYFRHLEVVEALLRHGARVNVAETVGNSTPLHWAIVNFPHTKGDEILWTKNTWGAGAMEDIVRVLLAHGANPNAHDFRGEVTLWHLCDDGPGYSTYAEQVAVAELLLAHGADINATNGGVQTPLTLANQVSPDFAVWLRAHGARSP